MSSNLDAVPQTDHATTQALRPDLAPHRGVFDDPRRRSPITALVLSCMPGLGQIYVGYYQQGFTNALVIGSLIALIGAGVARPAEPFLGLFVAFFWLYNMVDAWRRAASYNSALAGLSATTPPDDVGVANARGSLVGGAALVVVGLVLLAHTLFGLSLAWLEQWWPIVFVGVGVWLIYPHLTQRLRAHP